MREGKNREISLFLTDQQLTLCQISLCLLSCEALQRGKMIEKEGLVREERRRKKEEEEEEDEEEEEEEEEALNSIVTYWSILPPSCQVVSSIPRFHLLPSESIYPSRRGGMQTEYLSF